MLTSHAVIVLAVYSCLISDLCVFEFILLFVNHLRASWSLRGGMCYVTLEVMSSY